MDKVIQTYKRMRAVRDSYMLGVSTADELAEAVVDYTDSLLGMAVTYDDKGGIVRVTRAVTNLDR